MRKDFLKMDFEYNKKQTLYLDNEEALDTICHFINLSRKQVSMALLDPVGLKKKTQFSLDGKSVKFSSANKENIIIKRNDDGAISGIEYNNVNDIDKMFKQTKDNYEKNIYKSVDTYLYEQGLKRTHCLYEHKN